MLFIIFGMTPAGAGTLADDCRGPFVETSSEATEWTVPGEKTCFSTYLEKKTLWFVRAGTDVLTEGVTVGLPACSRGAGIRVLERTFDSLLLDVREAGWRSVCFAPTDRAAGPAEFRLLSRSLGSLKSNDPNENDPDPDPLSETCRRWASRSNDPNENDPDPDPLSERCRQWASRSNDPNENDPDPDPLSETCREWASRSNDPNANDPDPDPLSETCRQWASRSNDPNENDPDPDPLVGSGDLTATQQACRLAGAWGQRHMPTCAVSLRAGQWVEPGTGGLYRIDVADWQRLKIEVDGETAVALRDERGHHLGRHQPAGRTGAGAVAVNLAPGSYWLEAAGGAVRYTKSAL